MWNSPNEKSQLSKSKSTSLSLPRLFVISLNFSSSPPPSAKLDIFFIKSISTIHVLHVTWPWSEKAKSFLLHSIHSHTACSATSFFLAEEHVCLMIKRDIDHMSAKDIDNNFCWLHDYCPTQYPSHFFFFNLWWWYRTCYFDETTILWTNFLFLSPMKFFPLQYTA